MSDQNDHWEKLLNQLAEGSEVEWDTQEIKNRTDAELLAQLKKIHDIQKVFTTQNSTPDQAEDKPLKTLFEWGHLQVLEKLGEGGYGEVFRSFDPVLNREVALKLLKPDQLATFHSKLFIEEAQRIARVRNRHVLAIHGAAVNDGRAGFWSDLIVGHTLVNQTHMGLSGLLEVAASMSHALGAVHQAGLVHGDVKAANVMQDQNDQYVLMDFGAGLESGSEHVSNHSIGSPLLMAPELFQEQPKSPATDMYALGCLLFKLACGQYPIQGENILDVAAAHEQHEYLQLQSLGTGLPGSMIHLIHQLIAVNPTDRPDAFQLKKMTEDIISEPIRKKKKRLVQGIIGSLFVGLLLASVGLYFANIERQKAVLEQQKAQAVNDFLHEILGASHILGTGREVRVADVLDLAASNALNDFNDQPEILSDLTRSLGQSYQNLQVMDKSQEQLMTSLQLKSNLLGKSHPETLRVMLLLAKTKEDMGQYESSQALCESVIALSGDNEALEAHKLDAQVILSTVYTETGDFAAANVLLVKLIQQAKEAGVPSNHLYLALMAQSQNQVKLSEFKAAAHTAQEAIDTIVQVENYKATNLFAAKNQLAVALSLQGQYAQAEIIMVELLAMAKQFYGENNTGYLRILVNLGANLQSQGKLSQAVKIQEQAVGLTASLNGSRHHDTLMSKMNLANTYVSLNRLEEGEALMREVLELSLEVLGSEHVRTMTLQYNLGELLNNTGRFSESLALSLEALVVMQNNLGDAHLVTLLTHDNVAVSLMGLNRMQEANTYFEMALSGLIKSFGTQNPYYLLVRGHQIDALIKGHQVSEAVEALKQMIVVQKDLLGELHDEVIQSETKLQELLTQQSAR